MPDCKSWVTHIRQEIEASRQVRLWQDSINMLSTVSESVFSRSAHFILELLQNAEDAGSTTQTGSGEIQFSISPTRIKVMHNGVPFTDLNVDAICGVRSSKKPEEGTLGYLGIGFKSVFKVSDCPQVHSGGFHFKFDKSAFPNPANEPWQITPIWIDDAPESPDPSMTTFIIPFRNSEAYEQTLQELQKLDVHIFLFLKWLRRLSIVDEASGKRTLIQNLGETNRVASLKKDGQTHQFVVFRRVSLVPQEVAKDTSLEFYKRQTVKQREIVLAFGVDDTGNLQPIEDASALGAVSSFLPLVEERSGAKFLVQSDFLVQPGREAIQYELSWNHWLIGQAAELAKEAIEEFKKHPKWKEQFLPIFRFRSYPGQPSFDKLFSPMLHQPLSNYLKTTQVYPTESGHHVKAEQAVLPDENVRGLVSDGDLQLLFPGKTDLRLTVSTLDPKSVPEDLQLLIQRLELGRVARNKQFLEEKAKQPNHVQWFIKLYQAMAQTDQYFKEEVGRSSRGRYSSYESPIYVLTDKNTVVSAKDVYLREIPQEVLHLRKQFPEVDTLLNSYQLIHPKVATDPLVKFFKERTHVQPIDYDKICREVFLPKLRVTAQAPRKDELIAYSRLLQKGPTVDEPIWVITTTGSVKPSNQILFGSAYSPAEDWEKNAKYAPQIDFLSAEYLQGVPKSDIPGWKEFFGRLGVRERAENPYVEQFAMAFAEEKLRAELRNSVPKNRQQHGYDREATRIADGSLVFLEIKGQKAEHAVELDGNEPKAAQQAKHNKLPFWICVVPGIPENPQLWVIEDPLKVGQFNIVTIDISEWKASGRRVI